MIPQESFQFFLIFAGRTLVVTNLRIYFTPCYLLLYLLLSTSIFYMERKIIPWLVSVIIFVFFSDTIYQFKIQSLLKRICSVLAHNYLPYHQLKNNIAVFSTKSLFFLPEKRFFEKNHIFQVFNFSFFMEPVSSKFAIECHLYTIVSQNKSLITKI